MTNTNIIVTGSATNFSALQLSGTQFTNNNSVSICLMVGLSGLALIPLRVDSLGRAGSIF